MYRQTKNDKGCIHTTICEPTAAQLQQSKKLPVAKIKQNGTITTKRQQQRQATATNG